MSPPETPVPPCRGARLPAPTIPLIVGLAALGGISRAAAAQTREETALRCPAWAGPRQPRTTATRAERWGPRAPLLPDALGVQRLPVRPYWALPAGSTREGAPTPLRPQAAPSGLRVPLTEVAGNSGWEPRPLWVLPHCPSSAAPPPPSPCSGVTEGPPGPHAGGEAWVQRARLPSSCGPGGSRPVSAEPAAGAPGPESDLQGGRGDPRAGPGSPRPMHCRASVHKWGN